RVVEDGAAAEGQLLVRGQRPGGSARAPEIGGRNREEREGSGADLYPPPMPRGGADDRDFGRRGLGHGLQPEREGAGRLEALLRVLLQAAAHDPLEPRRQPLGAGGERRWFSMQDGREGVGGGLSFKGPPPGKHLVEDGP